MLTGKQKSYLRSLANAIEPVIQVGKGGVTAAVVVGTEQALKARELVKVTVLNNCADSAAEIAETLAGASDSQVVQIIGKKVVLYRVNPDNPLISLPGRK